MAVFATPTVAQFKAFFVREFNYGDGADKIKDADIQRALDESPVLFNQALLETVALQTQGYLYIAAHLMVLNIQTAGGLSAVARGRGVRNTGEGVQLSKGVGQVNVTYAPPPPRIANSPVLLPFWRTDFGQRYIQMLAPRLIGNMHVVDGPNANYPSRE